MLKVGIVSSQNTPYVFTVKTDNAGVSASDQFTLPLHSSAVVNCYVEWGDGTVDYITSRTDPKWTHTFPSAGTYTIRIYGVISAIRFGGGGDRLKLLNISNWGTHYFFGSSEAIYWGCSNLTITSTDIPNLRNTTNLGGAFIGCSSLVDIPNIGKWDVSQVTNFQNMFNACNNFEGNLSEWDLSNATNLNTMFFSCKINFSFANWNTSKVINMSTMFRRCQQLNQPITFDTSKVTNMEGMFWECTALQQNLGSMDISSLTNAVNFLADTTLTTANYNGLLSGWSANPNRKNNVTFSAGNAKYNSTAGGFDGTAGRDILTDTNSWSITDGGAD